MQALKKIIVRLLRDTANKLDAGTCEVSEEEAMSIINNMTHVAVSKEMACNYLNMSRSKFDSKVLEGIIPEGRKRVGFKEKVWYIDELNSLKK